MTTSEKSRLDGVSSSLRYLMVFRSYYYYVRLIRVCGSQDIPISTSIMRRREGFGGARCAWCMCHIIEISMLLRAEHGLPSPSPFLQSGHSSTCITPNSIAPGCRKEAPQSRAWAVPASGFGCPLAAVSFCSREFALTYPQLSYL